jgi:hypothetical protein
MASLARLAKLCGFKGGPPDMEEIEEALAAPRDRGKTHECYAEEQRDWHARATQAEAALAEARERMKKMEEALHACIIMYGDENPDDDWTAIKKARAALTPPSPDGSET